MRRNLKVLRVKHGLSQEEMAKRCGVGRDTYAKIEQGKRDGKQVFWYTLQDEFSVNDSEMYGLMKIQH